MSYNFQKSYKFNAFQTDCNFTLLLANIFALETIFPCNKMRFIMLRRFSRLWRKCKQTTTAIRIQRHKIFKNEFGENIVYFCFCVVVNHIHVQCSTCTSTLAAQFDFCISVCTISN